MTERGEPLKESEVDPLNRGEQEAQQEEGSKPNIIEELRKAGFTFGELDDRTAKPEDRNLI